MIVIAYGLARQYLTGKAEHETADYRKSRPKIGTSHAMHKHVHFNTAPST
jgi:hypothetical protein